MSFQIILIHSEYIKVPCKRKFGNIFFPLGTTTTFSLLMFEKVPNTSLKTDVPPATFPCNFLFLEHVRGSSYKVFP